MHHRVWVGNTRKDAFQTPWNVLLQTDRRRQNIGKSNYAENTCNTEDSELSKSCIVSVSKMILGLHVVLCMQSFDIWDKKGVGWRFLACGINNISQTVERVALNSKVQCVEIVKETNNGVSLRRLFRETCDKQKLFASSKVNPTKPGLWDGCRAARHFL